ncbi:hypothetical protein [Pseudorhodobacter sp.]|uniref:hypothetical protein n=1 Tax=Pseudorhodobacter sp. TaxID=1934400 RepID=UPI00264957BD|nr:hypothetical protein [Pseudorhodobacter sp.]MDN5787511.1 hypothetical protein [Pseudorhodobacter sp.]
MEKLCTRILMLLLCLGLPLFGAQAKAGQIAPGFAMTICSDAGAVTIYLNDEGVPVAPSEPCCDCGACLPFGAALPRTIMPPVLRLTARPASATPMRAAVSHSAIDDRPMPRGPPTAKACAMFDMFEPVQPFHAVDMPAPDTLRAMPVFLGQVSVTSGRPLQGSLI